jgi:hypothetical protein
LFLEGSLGLAGFLFSGIIGEKFRGVWRIENLYAFIPPVHYQSGLERGRGRGELRAESPKIIPAWRNEFGKECWEGEEGEEGQGGCPRMREVASP